MEAGPLLISFVFASLTSDRHKFDRQLASVGNGTRMIRPTPSMDRTPDSTDSRLHGVHYNHVHVCVYVHAYVYVYLWVCMLLTVGLCESIRSSIHPFR